MFPKRGGWDNDAASPGGDVLPGMNAGASTYAGPSPIEGSGTAWVLLGSWALSPSRPTPIHPRPERRGFSALLVSRSGVHTLRHTFSAHNVNNGMSIADLQKVLGHKTKETTLKYIHVVNTSLRETMLKTQA
jgi:hypothetical protein